MNHYSRVQFTRRQVDFASEPGDSFTTETLGLARLECLVGADQPRVPGNSHKACGGVIRTRGGAFLLGLLALWVGVFGALGAPTVSNVKFAVQNGTKLVDVTYDLAGATASIGLSVSIDNGTTYTLSVPSVTGHVGNGVAAGTGKHIVWDAGTDWPGQRSTQVKVRVTAWDLMQGGSYASAPIPGGTYSIGNLIGDSDITNAGTVSVTLSPYYMGVNATTKAQWDAVRTWATSNGYTALAAGAGKAANHPVQTVSWWDVVKWVNAASEKEGLTPCYKVSGTVLRTVSSGTVVCDWTANGYRLPTEAEWEVASRGGLAGKRFPWGDTISHSQANYYPRPGTSYDLSGSTNYYHPTYATGGQPYTSPVGSFAPNGYGIYDTAGNVWQWCWDWYGDAYPGGSDPRGPSSGSIRVMRGGGWDSLGISERCGQRDSRDPDSPHFAIGFHVARGRP